VKFKPITPCLPQKKKPVFINVGRGDITTCDIIVEAITKEYIDHAGKL